MDELRIELGERGYPILLGERLIGDAATWARAPQSAAALVVTNSVVAPLYLQLLQEALRGRHAAVHVVVLPDGEEHKTWASLDRIFDALLEHGCDRRTVIYALGGGVTGDVAGYAAASFMRGIPFVQVPTTLLAQVDSSVGGKTAINHPRGKNMIGAFHQPRLVVCDLRTLATLPERDLAAGLAEVIKYGPIADMAFLDWIEGHLGDLLARRPPALLHAVRRSCEIKAAIVSADEKEESVRAILNFGHTFGHAIEAGLGFGRWLHGEAVGCGMVMAAHLSRGLGLIDDAFVQRLTAIVVRAGLPVRGPDLGVERYLELMRLDKKAQAGEIRFVVLESPGRAAVRTAPDALVRSVIEACTR